MNMSLITIDSYYDVQFYNECKQSLENNGVQYKEYISTKPPYQFYFEVNSEPTFINYDVINPSHSRFLVNLVKPLKANDEYLYERRESYANIKAINHYAVNDALRSAQKSGQGVFFTATKDQILRISKDFPRKIWFMGRYFNRRYVIFFTDNLMVKNLLNSDQVLVESREVKNVTDLEVELNYRVFRERDRLEKLSETPYVLNGKFYPVPIRPELTDKYTL